MKARVVWAAVFVTWFVLAQIMFGSVKWDGVTEIANSKPVLMDRGVVMTKYVVRRWGTFTIWTGHVSVPVFSDRVVYSTLDTAQLLKKER